MNSWSSKQDGAREMFLYYAMHADLGDAVSRSADAYSPHVRGDGPAYKVHRMTIELPAAYLEKSLRERQAWLFDRLCEHLDEDGELLDFFATKLMERLGGKR